MLGLKLRDEFSGRRIKGTMIEMHNRNGTGALDKSASEFLKITYPCIFRRIRSPIPVLFDHLNA